MSEDPPARPTWRPLGGVFAVYFAFGVVVTSIAPMLPLVRAELGASRAAMGFVLGAWAMIFIVTAPVAGRVIDRYGLRLALAVGGISVAASALARAGAESVTSLWFAVAIFGVGGPLISAGAPVFVRQSFADPVARSRAVSVYVVAPALGSVVTLATTNSVLLPWLGSWRAVLVAEAALALVATGAWWVLSASVSGPAPHRAAATTTRGAAQEPGGDGWRQLAHLVRSSPALALALGLAFPIFFLNHALNTWSPTLLATLADIGVGQAANWVALAGLLGIGAALTVPSLGSGSARRLVLAGVSLVLGMACLALALGPPGLGPAAMLVVGVRAAMVPLAALLLMDAPGVDNRNAGVINGLWFSVGEVGGVSGPFVAGIVADSAFGFGGVAALLGAMATVTAALLVAVSRRQRPGERT
ncbi:MAG: MFS transporter [Actinomycetota bacterium]